LEVTYPPSLAWGYCVGQNSTLELDLFNVSYSLLCDVVDSTSPPTAEVVIFSGSPSVNDSIFDPVDLAHLALDFNNAISSCLAQTSVGVDAIAVNAEAPLWPSAYASVEADLSATLADDGLIDVDGDAEATVLQGLDEPSSGFAYGFGGTVGVGCPDPLPTFTVSTNNDLHFASDLLTGQVASNVINYISHIQTNYEYSCMTGVIAGESEGSLPSCALAAIQPLSPGLAEFSQSDFVSLYTAISPPTAPACASGATCSSTSTGSSTSNSSIASANDNGVLAAGLGVGGITVGQYSGDPESQSPPQPSGEYFDVAASSGNLFDPVTVTDCNLAGGQTLFWWTGSSWQAVTPQEFEASTGCITATLDLLSYPNSDQLAGTVFGVTSSAAITSPNTVTAIAGSSFSFKVTTVGTPLPRLREKGKLPKGVHFHDEHNGTATLSGTPKPTRTGTYNLTLSARFGTGKTKQLATQSFTLSLNS